MIVGKTGEPSPRLVFKTSLQLEQMQKALRYENKEQVFVVLKEKVQTFTHEVNSDDEDALPVINSSILSSPAVAVITTTTTSNSSMLIQ